MIKSFIIILLITLFGVIWLTGCAAVSELPTMKHCQHVKYERAGLDIVIAAECKAPIGGGV